MSHKNAKKQRQLLKRHSPELLVMFHEYFVKEKPRWMPGFIWRWRLSRYVYIPK